MGASRGLPGVGQRGSRGVMRCLSMDAGGISEDDRKMPWKWPPIAAAPVVRRSCVGVPANQAWAARTRRSHGVISSKKLVSSMDLVAQ